MKRKHFILALVAMLSSFSMTTYAQVAKVGNTEYETIDEAIAAWTNNTTLTLLSDVTLSDVVTLKSTEHHILNLGTYTMTAASGKNAFVIQACGTGSAERSAITINADATNPGGINAGSKCVVYYKYADGGISTEDRPIIKINGGVFTGSTSSWGTAGIYTIGTAARKCATLNISGGTFNCSINGSGKSKLIISGGVFNYSVGSQGDSTASRLISGGKFKTLGFMTADSNNTKFWFGTSMANSNVGLYVDDEGYLCVGGPVITELSPKYKAVASNATKWSSYLAYSSAATNGLYYTDAEAAIKKHGEANVTVYEHADAAKELDNNAAVKDFTPELPSDIVTFEVEAIGIEATAEATTKVTFNVEPKDASGAKVSNPSAAITFRLPVPAAWAGKANVYHEGTLLGAYTINEENDAKFVEVSSSSFSEFSVEAIVPLFAGEGTEASPYIIDSSDKLVALSNSVNAGETYAGMYFKLTSDITLSGEWTAIGNGSRSSKSYTGNAFKGVFDGCNNTISGLTIASTSDKNAAVGLFGVVDGGTVKNLTLNDVNINVANSNLAGAAIGMMLNGATADNITVNGAVTGNDGVGGIVGRLIIDGTIANCINNASVTSSYGGIGGIVGKAYYEDGANTSTFASIENCTNNGTVTAPMYVGGIAGLARANVTGCVNNGEVAGGTQTGGIVGQLMAAGTVSGNENKAKIAGKNHLGGIIGDYSQSSDYTYYNVSIANNTNRGELAATEQCAAIMGCNNIDGFTAMTATGNQSYYYVDGLELFGNPEDMVIDATNKFVVPVAQVGEQTFYTFAEAAAAAQAGSEIKLLANIEGDITVPANVTLNGNGFAISGGIFAEGDITFAGVTTAADFDANVANTAVNIPAGASLQLTGTARLVIGHGATFNITGTIEDAKTADKATLVPSLKIAAGASITGNGVTFNVNNAYIVANANTTSKNSNANGTLDFNINNSIWEQTGVLAFYVPTSGKDPVVNFELKNSVLTTTSHLVFSVTKGEIVIDNSLVNQGTSRQLENRSTMTIKNGSVVNGAVATSSNAINPGTIIVENATYAVTGEFSGAAEGTGTLVIKKGANVSVGSIKAGANVTVDAEGMAAGDEINFTANLSQFTGTLSVINNDKLEASIVDGKVVLAAKPVAKIGEQKFATLQDALDAAAAGTGNVTVEILSDVDLTDVDWNPVTVSDPGYPVVTVEGNDKTITGLNDMLFAGTWAGGSGLIIKNLTIANSAIVNDKDDTQGTVGVGAFIGFPQASATITLENCHLKNSSVEGGHWTGGLIGYAAGYAGTDGPVFMNLTIKNCSVTGSTITGKGSAGGIIGHGSGNAWTNVVIEATTVSGNTITSTGSSTNKAGAVMGTIGAAGQPTTVNGVTHTGGMSVSATVAGNTVKSNDTVITTIYGRQGTPTGMLAVAGGTYDNYPIEQGVAYAAPAAGYKIEQNTDGTYGVVVDPAYGMVAKVGDEYFATLQEAINAAQNDETVVLLNTITLADADMVKTEDNRNVMLNISNKSITLDLNENTINIDYNGGQYLFAAVYVADGAGLTVTGNGKIDIAENGINVAYMFWKRGTTGYLTIENGTFHMDDSGDSMVYTNGDEIVTVNGGTFTIDNIDTRPNQFPCIFNAAGQNTANIIVNGGTFNDDVAHQYYPFEVMMPREKALKKSESENLWTVVDAVAYVAEKEDQYINEVGYATLDEAITAAEAGETVTLLSNIETVDGYIIPSEKKLVLDLNGKTITGTDNATASYGLITINPGAELTINDATGEGAIKLTAANDREWNAYSSVISNQRGKLTVNGGTIDHLGGTAMAYGIDNLTNGKGTYAETIINGGTIKSTYRAIRQFLNGVEAQNILTINGGTIEGANKSVWMQDPSKNPNTGTLTVGENAKLMGDVYLYVTPGSTEWPVEVSIAAAALQDESKVVTGNVPAAYAVEEVNGTWSKANAVASTGGVGYTSINEAINAAADGATVEILAGEHSEYVAPWVGDTQHQTEKSITLVGAADFATVLTGGMYLGYDDSQCREHNIVVKGIAFQGKGLTVACQQNVTIEDNKFTNITEGRAIAVIGKDINSVVKNNVIENVASAAGIELRNTLTATVEGNTISGTGHNALQITSQVGSTASTATVLNNTMSDWGVNGEGRAMRFEGIVTATVNGNVMTHTAAPEEFAKITNTTTLDASANYWNGVSPMTSGMFTGVEGDPIAVLKNYYTDAEKTNLVEFSAAGSAACIGSAYFETLAAAITAAQANDVITFLTDINESVTVNKSVTIDGADKTLTGKITTKGSGATLKITIKNITFDGNNQEYDYAVRADNNSKLVIENCSADNYSYGFLYANKTNDQILVKDVTVKNANYGAHLVSINKATFENVTVKDGKYGVMIQNQGSRNVVFNNCTMTNVETPLHVWEKGTANITFAFEGTNEMGVEQLSSSQYAVYKNAAMVGTTVYGDLNDAAAAAAADGTVTLLGNMAIESDLNNAAEGLCNIAADAQVTIDLNGKTIDVTDKSAGNFIVFYNYGNLTIKNGTVNLVAENNRAWNAQSTIILNRGGELTIESGTYTHLGGTDMAFALDNSGNSFGDAYATIVDGTLESTYTAIRNRMADPTLNGNPGNGIAELTIQGGLIKGVKRGIWGQITNASSDFLGSLTVTGGTIEATDAIRMDADSHENITVEISDEAVIKGNLAGDYADYNVTGGTFYNEVEEGYLAWGYQLVGDAAPYTVAYTGKVSELTIVDGELDEFVNEQEVTVGTLTYERTFTNVNAWQALYVPFKIPVETLINLGYEVSYLYDVHNKVVDGEAVDPSAIESIHMVKVTTGTLKANYPYNIRPTSEAALSLVLKLYDVTLYSTDASEMISVESSTTTTRYIFAGTYTKASRATLTGSDDIPCFRINPSGTWTKMSATANLIPFRICMYVVNKDGSPVIVSDETAKSIQIRIVGEENEDGTTTIYDVEADEQTVDYIYDLQGRRVLEPQKGGLYIVNGKKVVF